ncbi:hypothetical protein CPB83DRAFT_897019 [Crepidotus variabilis]|uniref:F-box domain-containing protein n=1 Tax=Crepidotus variabilis TaxID=179855 RepID=A0A9P6EAL6_9AGAR|nr:hypothetical protein CPB83DRAFT_897019 [Crepidotus variabilis]
MDDLPYEIWYLIVQYLPSDEVENLFSVSRALFNIALDLHYREVHLPGRARGPLMSKHLKKINIYHLRNPLVVSRPREVHILDLFDPWPGVQAKKSVLESARKYLFKSKKPYASQTNALKQVVEIIPFLTSVTTLHVEKGFEGFLQNPEVLNSGLFFQCWAAFGSQLKVLSLATPLEIFHRVTGQDLHLPCLEVLRMQIWDCFQTTEPNSIISTQVIPFIQRNQATICNLKLDIEDYTIDVSALLGPLESMCQLSSLDLKTSYTNCLKTNFIGLERLLRARRHELHTLRIRTHHYYFSQRFQTFAEFFQSPCWHIPLPKLKTLDIEPPLSEWKDLEYAYLVRFKSSLTTLRLSPNIRWQYPEVACLTNILTPFENLKYLELLVFSMSPALLSLFATSIPQLETLRLFYKYIFANLMFPSEASERFVEELQKYNNLSSWNLKELDYCESLRTVVSDGKVEVALVDKLSNVQWFCGLYRDEFKSRFIKLVG